MLDRWRLIIILVTAIFPILGISDTQDIGEEKTISIHDSLPQYTPPSRPIFYPGHSLVLEIIGQIDANHDQWEDEEHEWIDIFHWFPKKVRRHRSNIRSQADVGALFLLVDGQGRVRNSGSPTHPRSDSFSTDVVYAFTPNSSGDGWSYNVESPNRSTLAINLKTRPGQANNLFEQIFLQALIGNRINNSNTITRENCDVIRLCSERGLRIKLVAWETSERLRLVKDYLQSRRPVDEVIGLLDLRLIEQNSDELAVILLNYIDNLPSGNSKEDAKSKILSFAIENIRDKIKDTQIASKLNRAQVEFEIERGNLDAAVPEIKKNIDKARIRYEANKGDAKNVASLDSAIDYASWLTTASEAYLKDSEKLSSKDLNRAIGLLRTARDVLNGALAGRVRDHQVSDAQQKLGSISITLARLLGINMRPVDLEEAAKVLDQARHFYIQGFEGSLVAGIASNRYFALSNNSNSKNGALVKVVETSTGAWRALPTFSSLDHWIFKNENTGRLSEFTLDDSKAKSIPLPIAPTGATQEIAISGGVIWISPFGDVWRGEPGAISPITVLKAPDQKRRTLVLDGSDPSASTAILVDEDGAFSLITELSNNSQPIHLGIMPEFDFGSPLSFSTISSGSYEVAWQSKSNGIKTAKIDIRNPSAPVISGSQQCEDVADKKYIKADSLKLQNMGDESIALLLVSGTGVQLAILNHGSCEVADLPEFEKNTILSGALNVWTRKNGWLLTSAASASNKIINVKTTPQQSFEVINFSSQVKLDRGAIREPSADIGEWLVVVDSTDPDNIEIANLDHLDDDRVSVRIGTVANDSSLVRPHSHRVINSSTIGVEHPLAHSFSLYSGPSGEPIKTVKPLATSVNNDIQPVFATRVNDEVFFLADMTSDGSIESIRKLSFEHPLLSFLLDRKWVENDSLCKLKDCTSHFKVVDSSDLIPSRWRFNENAMGEADGFIELVSAPIQGDYTQLPISNYEIGVRIHDTEGGRATKLIVQHPQNIVGTIKGPSGRLFTLLKESNSLVSADWGGSREQLIQSLPDGQVRIFRGNNTNTGVIVTIPKVGGGSLSAFPYEFNESGKLQLRKCLNCINVSKIEADVRSIHVLGDQNVVIVNRGDCIDVRGLLMSTNINNQYELKANVLSGDTFFASSYHFSDSIGVSLLVSSGINHFEINRILPGTERNDCPKQ